MFLKDVVSDVLLCIFPLILLAVCVIGIIILSCRNPEQSSISSTFVSSTQRLKQHDKGTVHQNVHYQTDGASLTYHMGYPDNSPGFYGSDRQAYAALRQNETVYLRSGRPNVPASAVNANRQEGGYGIVRLEELLEALHVRLSDEQNESSLGVKRLQGSSRTVEQTRPSEYDVSRAPRRC